MSTILIAELFLIGLLAAPVLHIFAKNKEPARACAILAPAALLIVLLLIIFRGASAPLLALAAAAVLVCICTLRQFARLVCGLKYDSTPLSYAAAVFLLPLLAAAAVFCVLFSPVAPPDFAAGTPQMKIYKYTRADKKTFVPKERFYEPTEAVLTVISPSPASAPPPNPLPAMLYLPDIYAGSSDCAATALALAERGFTVVLADFYLASGKIGSQFFSGSFIRPFIFRMQDFFMAKDFSRNKKNLIQQKETELAFFINLAKGRFAPAELQNRPLYLAAEGNIKTLAENLKAQYPEAADGVFYINTARKPIPDYFNGYGNLAAFHPFEAFLRAASRDENWEQARFTAHALMEEWNESK